jgi:hypothetical protein
MNKKTNKFQQNYFKAVHGKEGIGAHVHQWQGKRGFREPSIEVKSDWPLINENAKSQLEKLTLIEVKQAMTEQAFNAEGAKSGPKPKKIEPM